MNYLDSLTNFERIVGRQYSSSKFGLARMNRILSELGNPHREFKSVHIVGTKGKGSTAAMLAAMLRNCGVRVGLYSSPHILSLRERIVVDSKMISEAAFARTVAAAASVTTKARVPDPTYFELITAAAFKYFADQKVDIAVVEAGLGGRLDSTNVIHPEVLGITSISHDHFPQLGTSLESITKEKVGAVKKKIPVISAPQNASVREIIREATDAASAPLR